VIKDDPELLVMWREEMKPSVGRKPHGESVDNINALETAKGTSKSYTLTRLEREHPELAASGRASGRREDYGG